MKQPSKNEPQLTLIEKDDAQESSKADEEVAVLQPDDESLAIAKMLNPDVSQIIYGETDDDTEALWGRITNMPPLGWLILAGLILCGIGIWATFNLLKARPVIEAAKLEKNEHLIDIEKEHKEDKKILLNMEDSVRGYLAADSLEKILPFVRHQDRVKPLMEHYYSQHNFEPDDFKNFSRIRSMGLENQPFVYGKVSLTDGSTRKLLIEELTDGSFRVDWESDVCYQPMEWDQYIKSRPFQATDMRVKITPDTFYAYEFKDESRFQCYRITTRNSDQHLFGYALKSSPAAKAINKLMQKSQQHGGGKNEPMILRLSFPEKTNSKKCVWIDALLAPRWTYVDPPQHHTPAVK